MGFQSLTVVLRVSEARLRRMIDAAARVDFSYSRHTVWVEHILGDRVEVDITDQLCHDYEEFPLWLRGDSHVLAILEQRGNRLFLHQEYGEHAYRRQRRDEDAAASWQRFGCCPFAQCSLESTGWLCSRLKLPTGLLQFAHAADLLALSGAARRLHFLAHDLARSEELAIRMRQYCFDAEVRLCFRATERRRTLAFGRVDMPATVSVTYTQREVLAQDARGIVQTGADFLCGSMRFAESRGAQKGWHIVRVWASGGPEHLAEAIRTTVNSAKPDYKAAIDGLMASEFWVEAGDGDGHATRPAGARRMEVHVVLQRDKEYNQWRRHDDCVEDCSRKHETEDAISRRIPQRHRIPGGNPRVDPGDYCFCEFFVLPAAEVPAFGQELQAELVAGVEEDHPGTVEHLALVVRRAAEEGQALFMQYTCG